MREAMRLDKRLVELIHCSRGEAQRYIEGGWVLVEGEVVEQPQVKVLGQTVTLHPDATLEPLAPVTLLLNYPQGFDVAVPTAPLELITPATHAQDDRSGIRLLKRHFAGLRPTTPLEVGATGLLVFTHDWRVVRRLVEDAARNEQEYVVELSDEITPEQLAQLNRPMSFNNRPLPALKVSRQSEHRLRFALKSVRPGQIAFMCQSVGLKLVAMKRVRIGRVALAKLPPGQWRYLAPGLLF
ncbi:MAG: rRNA pseudouridine synthase [Gammaproteobacteria bacterium]|nr:rRNA pseudouridine synthase [Gammaproteobacteria bacterium]